MTTKPSPNPDPGRTRSTSLARLKRTIVAGSVAAFVATWGLLVRAEPPAKIKPVQREIPAQPRRVIIRVKPVLVQPLNDGNQAIALAKDAGGTPRSAIPQFEPLPPIPDLPAPPPPRPAQPAPNTRTSTS
ncbi:MAG: hypothetical protein A2Z04_01030 [Chloroflexi bacterium RBG_16_57_9]|nr:MAG: hypothetical protein A2Z04_01030 [Chloroflexi bacterium RBG_16_57_9]